MKFVIIFFCFLFVSYHLLSQESEHDRSKVESPHGLSFMVGYAWVPQIINENEIGNEVQVIPTLGFDYAYFLSNHWGLGIINDIEFATYFVEDGEGGFLERENKYIGALTAIYEPNQWLVLFGGPGIEVDKHQTFPLIKLGFEIGMRLEKGWSWGISVSVDYNELYETYSAGLLIGKRLP